jgi:glycosyltransferase involved in cell wall biosynthesis
MNILLMTYRLGYWGGAEQYIVDCLQEFTRLGHACSLVYAVKSTKPLEQEIAELLHGAYQITTLLQFESAKDAIEVERLNVILERERPEVIFMCEVRNYALLSRLRDYGGLVPMSHSSSLLCMRMSNITYFRRKICTHKVGFRCLMHGCFVRKNPNNAGSPLVYNSLRKHRALLGIYRSIGIHVVASNYMKQRLVQHGFQPEQVTVVGYFTHLQPLPAISLNGQRPIISFMGRVDRYKGVDYLMRALARLSTPFKCLVIGDGKYLPYCKKLAHKLGMSDVVDFAGWLPNQEITARLRAVSMVVVPSILPEPFGIVGIEAMKCSKPVVAFDVGGISDWLRDGKNGYLVPVKNTTLLAEKIDALLGDPQTAADMGAEGYRLVMSNFSKEQHFGRLLSVFEEAITRRTRNKYVFKIID